MNRSILIVICDFLLVNMLAFSSVDIKKVETVTISPEFKLEMSNPAAGGQDLTNLIKLAKWEENKENAVLAKNLREAQNLSQQEREALEAARAALATNQALLAQQAKEMQARDKELGSRRLQTLQLEDENAALKHQYDRAFTNIQVIKAELTSEQQVAQRLAKEKAQLQQQYAAATASMAPLQDQLRATAAAAAALKNKEAEAEAELRRQQQRAEALARSNQLAQIEMAKQAAQRDLAEAKRAAAEQQLTRADGELRYAREQTARLAGQNDKLVENILNLTNGLTEVSEGVRNLITQAVVMARSQPLSHNLIYNDFISNRVHASFQASRPGIFTDKHRESDIVLLSDGTNTYGLCHVEDTPLRLEELPAEWKSLTGTLSRDAFQFAATSLWFARQDPRVVLLPLTQTQVRDLGVKVYRMSPDSAKFDEAVIVGTQEHYYGTCKYQIDETAGQYLKMDHSFLKGLFGKFNPSRGDLVLSKNGDLLGLMVNNTYCVMVQSLTEAASLRLGPDVRDQHTAKVLSEQYQRLSLLPAKVR